MADDTVNETTERNKEELRDLARDLECKLPAPPPEARVKREQLTDVEWERFGRLCECIRRAKQSLKYKNSAAGTTKKIE